MLIVTVISLTIGVAISSRAISTLRQTSYTAQAGKAQKFADAGIEHALPDPGSLLACTTTTPCELDLDGGGADVKYTVTQSGDGPTVEATLEKDQTIEIDLTGYGPGDAVNIYWISGAAERVSKAALVLAFIYDDSGTTKLEKHAYDPNAVTHGNNFTTPSSSGPYTIGGTDYDYYAQINTPSGTTNEALRVRPLYNDVKNSFIIERTGTNTFTTQGYTITSTGTYGEAEWTAEVTKMNPALPAIFDFAIFSESDLVK